MAARWCAGRAPRGNAHVVLVAVFGLVELSATRHQVALRLLAIRRLGIETTKVDLDADLMSGFVRRRPECAEPRVGPVLLEIARPADELRSERALVGGSRPIARCRRHVIRIGVFPHHAIRRELRGETRHAGAHLRDPGLRDLARVSRVKRGHDFTRRSLAALS